MEDNYNYFVAAAVIAAKLNEATKVAKNLSLTASNARAVALRAGEGAAGFKPLTEFIDRLAHVTIISSREINTLAANLSKMAANKFRADSAISRFNIVYKKAAQSEHIHSLDESYTRTKLHQSELSNGYSKQLLKLIAELEQLKDELRTAVILATLSRVEASQAGDSFQEQLNNVAENVEVSAGQIKEYLTSSLQLVGILEQEST